MASLKRDMRGHLCNFEGLSGEKVVQDESLDVKSIRSLLKLASKNGGERSNVNAYHVRFMSPIVTEIRTRPRTSRRNKSKLFYTPQEYLMFRKDYRAFMEGERSCKYSSPISTLFSAISFASNYISGLEIISKGESQAEDNISEAKGNLLLIDVSASDLSDILYLY